MGANGHTGEGNCVVGETVGTLGTYTTDPVVSGGTITRHTVPLLVGPADCHTDSQFLVVGQSNGAGGTHSVDEMVTVHALAARLCLKLLIFSTLNAPISVNIRSQFSARCRTLAFSTAEPGAGQVVGFVHGDKRHL